MENSGGTTSETIEGLKNSIAAYEKRIEKHVEDAAKTGTYWKILAVRLQDRGLHGEALNALDHAVYYTPEDPAIHYSIGISAGILAKSLHASPGAGGRDRGQYFTLAEQAFQRAIELDSRYLRPRYGLGVLYVFELDRPEEAVLHLERCLEISRNDVDTMFVLARAFYMMKRYQEAVDLYDRIITLTRDGKKRIDAQNNRQTALEQIYG
jgi:tetratricopeptide (TPR) repeat protein